MGVEEDIAKTETKEMRLTESTEITNGIKSDENLVYAQYINLSVDKNNVPMYEFVFTISGSIENDNDMGLAKFGNCKFKTSYVAELLERNTSYISFVTKKGSLLNEAVYGGRGHGSILNLSVKRALAGSGNLYVWCEAHNVSDPNALARLIWDYKFKCSLSHLGEDFFLDIVERTI